jgi:hypothetical protein
MPRGWDNLSLSVRTAIVRYVEQRHGGCAPSISNKSEAAKVFAAAPAHAQLLRGVPASVIGEAFSEYGGLRGAARAAPWNTLQEELAAGGAPKAAPPKPAPAPAPKPAAAPAPAPAPKPTPAPAPAPKPPLSALQSALQKAATMPPSAAVPPAAPPPGRSALPTSVGSVWDAPRGNSTAHAFSARVSGGSHAPLDLSAFQVSREPRFRGRDTASRAAPLASRSDDDLPF